MLDQDLLEAVRQAAAGVEQAERSVQDAQERYRVAVRRLHIAGLPLREIAKHLNLSHQRVHQLVEGPGRRKRRWKARASGSPGPMCSFCGKDRTAAAKLVSGPDVCICNACINNNHALDAVHPQVALRCSFCGKGRSRVKHMFAAASVQMCGECRDLAREIIASP
jgi:hypothetical protein